MPINHSILQSVEIILPNLHQNDESAYSPYQIYSFAQICILEWFMHMEIQNYLFLIFY